MSNFKPNFFIVGTPKAGTTSLYHYLEEHPEVYMSPIKETNFFSYDNIKKQGLFYNEEHLSTLDEYLAQFNGVTNEKAIGEASVSYMFYPDVPSKLKAFEPNAKIIIVLRNPIDRGFSHYLMDERLGFVNIPYEDIVLKKNNDRKNALYYQQYVELGLYYRQLQRYFSVFDKSQIKIFLYEELTKDINAVIHQLFNFLEVDDNFKPNSSLKHNAFLSPENNFVKYLYKNKAIRSLVKKTIGTSAQDYLKNTLFTKEKKPILELSLKQELIKVYKDDINSTAQLLNLNLKHWYSE